MCPLSITDESKRLWVNQLALSLQFYASSASSFLRAHAFVSLQGPVTEECLFRSAAIPLLLVAGSSLSRIILLSPVVFGLAHLHHFYEFRVTHPQTPLVAAIARSVLQFSYTSVFGAYANFLFLRTGSLLAVVVVHAFCNSMGLPRVWGAVQPYWLSEDDAARPARVILWSGIYYALLVGGSVAWWKNLYFLTESPLALAVF